jgi:hypothetical protein
MAVRQYADAAAEKVGNWAESMIFGGVYRATENLEIELD